MIKKVSDNLIRTAFEKFSPIDDDTWKTCQSCWHKSSFRKGEIITKSGSVEKYLYVVESGVQRMAHHSENGQEITLGFTFSPSFSGAYDSFLYGHGSWSFIEALSDSVLWGITRTDLMNLFDRSQSMERWGREFAQQILVGRGKREIELLTRSASDRFNAFVERSPSELLEIPQKYLASYLNMTPETYSRIRNERNIKT